MTAKLLFFFLFLTRLNAHSTAQERVSLFKGLYVGMTENEVKAEYKKNKTQYTNVEIGSGRTFKTILFNMIYSPKGGLVGIKFFIKGTLLSGIGYDNTVNEIESIRQTFEDNLGYSTLYQNDFWNAPKF